MVKESLTVRVALGRNLKESGNNTTRDVGEELPDGKARAYLECSRNNKEDNVPGQG